MIGLPKSTFVPKDTADDSVLSLPKDKRDALFDAQFGALLHGATNMCPEWCKKSESGLGSEPEKKE